MLERVPEAGRGRSGTEQKIKESQAILERKVLAKYKALKIEEIKTLVVEDKWLARLEQDVQTEMQRISQRLTGRIKELAERYGETLPKLEEEVEKMEKTVKGHLGKMGFNGSEEGIYKDRGGGDS